MNDSVKTIKLFLKNKNQRIVLIIGIIVVVFLMGTISSLFYFTTPVSGKSVEPVFGQQMYLVFQRQIFYLVRWSIFMEKGFQLFVP